MCKKKTTNRQDMTHSEQGFTLIELMVIVMLIGILSYLSLVAFELYRANAAYASVESTLHSATVAAEASQSDPNNLPPPLGWYMQMGPGAITDPAAASYLVGLKLPRQTRIVASYDPNCVDAGCLSDFVEIWHCLANETAFWVRWGDGFSWTFRNVPGGGC
ncbi:MAG: type II secretion system protein [SAR324 cluster bacterium]|uniref:Type II secretion system protein n=1 Tax=SAR324 cluster bacterium TaxID=2024889 RepID=A0A7X9IMK4_9DELT|nr:type II secretion system protein [SAR324 cluster bacterium]